MTPKDYYDILGVPRNASSQQIKKAFRQLAQHYHPDVSQEPDAEERFKEINEAYQVLSDDQKRAAYDRFGHAGLNGMPGGGFSGGIPSMEEILEEFFGGLGGFGFGGFGSGRRRRGAVQGRDLHQELRLSFEQAVFGAEIDFDVTRRETCGVCKGSGAEPGTQPRTCPECNGTGQVRRVQQAFGFNMVNVTDCPRCKGRGEIITTPCEKCNGTGRMRVTRRLNVTIPAGVDDGMKIRIQNEGEPGDYGGPPGGLYVIIRVKEHEFFKRRNDDILLEITINVAQAALGDTITVPTVDGDTQLRIPPGTQTGESFRMRGKGFPRLRRDGTSAGRGDQWVIVQVIIPRNLTEKQRALFEELAKTLDTQIIRPQSKGFFDRVLDFLSGEPTP